MTKGASKKVYSRNFKTPLILFIAILFLISVGFLIFGLTNSDEINTNVIDNQVIESEAEGQESVSKYFENGVETSVSYDNEDEFSVGDPFKETCAPFEGDDVPAINSGTVCLH